MAQLEADLLIGALVLIAAIIAARIGSRLGLPSLLLFLGIGMLMGDSVLGIQFDNAEMAQSIGFGALVLILAEGGMTTKWSNIKSSTAISILLATVGVGVSVGLMTLFGHFVLDLPLHIAVLLGAVTSPTDAAAVFSVLRRVPLPHRLRGALEGESGLNDAPTVLVVIFASAAAVGRPVAGGVVGVGGLVLLELIGGLAIGAGLGWLGMQLLRRVTLPSSGLYALATLGWSVLAYAVASELNTSGFAAVYVCGLVLGNANLPHRVATRSFVEGIGSIAQIGLFVMLGLLATPKRLNLEDLGLALAAGLFLTLIARPVSVLLSSVWFKGVTWADRVFLSWSGLRGAVPIVLTTIPLAEHVPHAALLFDVVLVFVIIFTVLQAPTLGRVATWLRLTNRDQPSDVEVEVAPLGQLSADMLQVKIPDGSKLNGVEIGELRLGKNAVVSLIIRNREPLVPGTRDQIRTDDELLIVTPTNRRVATEKRLRAIGRGGRLASWRLESGEEE